ISGETPSGVEPGLQGLPPSAVGARRSLRDRRRESSKRGRTPAWLNEAFVRRPQALTSVPKSRCEPGAPVVPRGDAEARQPRRTVPVGCRLSAARCAAAATPRLLSTEAAACPQGNAGAPGG